MLAQTEMALITFTDYMIQLLEEKKAQHVVEIGPDRQVRLARDLSGSCVRYTAVALPEDYARDQDCFEHALDMADVTNVTIMPGNAIDLSQLVHSADVIVIKNVLFDLTGEDTALMWRYRRKEEPCTDELWNALLARFDGAEEKIYRECLSVAHPGTIIRFGREKGGERFRTFLNETLKINPANVQCIPLLYDTEPDSKNESWEAHVINNP